MMRSGFKEAIQIINNYRKKGVTFYLEEGKLKYKAKKNNISADDMKLLKEMKPDIISVLENEAIPIKVEYNEAQRYEPFDLTDVQSAYLIGRNDAFDYAGVACHIYIEQKYDKLDIHKAEEVWNQLIKRHEMLRAVITEDGKQKILQNPGRLNIKCKVVETDEEERAVVNEMRREMGHRVYDTAKWPLFDIAATETADQTIIHFSIEFLIADWTSIWMLFSEFETLYYNENAKLTELHLSFKDYLTAERKLRETLKYADDKEYWMSRIDILPTSPQLPIRPKEENKPHFKRMDLYIDRDNLNMFEKFAQNQGVTVTSGVLGAYASVLEKWSASSDFTLNLTILNRLALDPEVNQIVGDFTSVNMLEVNWRKNKAFNENVSSISKRLFEDLDHRTFSGVEVIREISRKRGKQEALMPIVFTSAIGLAKTVGNSVSHGKYEGNGISQTPQVFIDCQAMDREDGLWINWDVREGVFPDGMIEDMFTEFKNVLYKLCKNEQNWKISNITELPYWQIEQRMEANATLCDYPDKIMFEDILRIAEKYPDKIAIADDFEKTWTYKEVISKSWSIANFLRENGIEKGSRVGITMPKSALQAISAVAILLAGCAYVPIDLNQPEVRRNKIINASGIKCVLESNDTNVDFGNTVNIVNVENIIDNETPFFVDVNKEDLAYIIYTSGTTGEPKGVMISHNGAMNTIIDINTRFEVNHNDSILGLSQLGFDLSVYDIFGILSVGGTLVYPNAENYKNPAHWYKLMEKYKVTLWNSVPAFFRMFISFLDTEKNILLKQFRLAMLSGDWIPTELPGMANRLIPSLKLVSLGGATEASIWSIFYEINKVNSSWKSIPYGKPLANQTFYIKDGYMDDCPVYVVGDIYIGGKGLAIGYADDKELTDRKFLMCSNVRMYNTGDRGRYLPDGNIEFLGRSDNQIKIRGYRIELGEIEECIKRCDGVDDSVATIYESGEERSIFAVFTSKLPLVDTNSILQQLGNMLPEYMIPSQIKQLDKIVLTLNGKVDRKSILQYREADGNNSSDNDGMPENEIQKMVYEILSELLNDNHLKCNDNLYNFGADSLIIAQAVGNIRRNVAESYGVDIAFDTLLREVINHPNILKISEFIDSHVNGIDKMKKNVSDVLESKYCSLDFRGGEDTSQLRVFIHGGLGSTSCFNKVIQYLEKQQSGTIACVNIADTNVYCSTDPSELIDVYSSEYAKQIAESGCKKAQVIGYSIGGMLAIETARHLVERGIEVADTVLIDIPPMLYKSEDELLVEMLFVMNMNIDFEDCGFNGLTKEMVVLGITEILSKGKTEFKEHWLENLCGTPELDKAGELFSAVARISKEERMERYASAIIYSRGEAVTPEMVEMYLEIFTQSTKAVNYTPESYVGNVRFFEAETPFISDESFTEQVHEFWEDVCLGNISFIPVKGNHFTCVENDEYAAKLAEKLLRME